MTWIVEATQVTKTFERQSVLNKVNLNLEEGSIHAVVGPNGAGKSTLFKLLVGLLNPDEGNIRLFGQSIEPTLRQRIHYISPEVNLYPLFRVENVLHYTSLLYDKWDYDRCIKLVEGLQIPLKKTIRQLSLGMKMRLRILIALASQADVLLMDEATNGIDPVTKEQILDLLLQENANRNTAVLMATHNLSEVERIADTVSILLNGRIVATKNIDCIGVQFHEVHMVVTADTRDELFKASGLENCVVTDDHISTFMEGDKFTIRKTLEALGAKYVEILPASMGNWFNAMLQKEGLKVDKISLSERTRL